MNMTATPGSTNAADAPRRGRTVLAGAAVGFALLLAAACGSSSPSASSTSTGASTASTATTAATAGTGTATTTVGSTAAATTASQPAQTTAVGNPATTVATSGASGCTSGAPTHIPAGAASEKTLDVDGDGKPDTLWVASGSPRNVGIITAAGGGSEVTVNSASPAELEAFVVNAQGGRPFQLLVSVNRVGYLYVWTQCKLVPVTNKQGQHYTFDLGFGDYGTGVGCNTIGGVPHLVGLDVTSQSSTAVHWSRTIVDIVGTQAHNGSTQTGTFNPATQAYNISLLHTLSCGSLTISKNGVTAPG